MISGASHLQFLAALGVALVVKLGLDAIGANPYSVRRA